MNTTATTQKLQMIVKYAAKFQSLENAQGWANKGRNETIIHGDDGRYWVVSIADAAYLVKLGFERAPRFTAF